MPGSAERNKGRRNFIIKICLFFSPECHSGAYFRLSIILHAGAGKARRAEASRNVMMARVFAAQALLNAGLLNLKCEIENRPSCTRVGQ